MPYTVSRQHQWPDEGHVVEVSAGGQDYTNPDALVPRWGRLGEGETFDSPILAVEAAIKICEAWRRDGCPEAQVDYGATGGATMPFDACTYEEAREWAVAREQELPFCARCGELLTESFYTHQEMDDQQFCSSWCAEEFYEEHLAQEPSRVCDSCREAAADHGVPDRTTQETLMVGLGADLADHVCDVVEAQGAVGSYACTCACRRR